MTKYITISLPEDMLDYIEFLRKHPLVQRKYHFTGKSDFVRRGITMIIDKIEDDIKTEEQLVPHSVLKETIKEEPEEDSDADPDREILD